MNVSNLNTDRVQFGLVVTFENLNTEKVSEYQIVSELEADQRNLSDSTIIKPLLGREVGDIVEL